MKKLLALGLAAAISLSLFTGCTSGKKVAVVSEDPSKVPESSYEINWYYSGDELKDTPAVEQKVNEYLKDKINATVKLNRLPGSQYQEKLSAMIATGEYFDACFVANWMLSYSSNATNGAWYPLSNDDLNKYMPKTKELIGDDILNNAKVNGTIYAIPNMKEMAYQYGWVYRKDLADKYNINMNEIKDLESLKSVLLKIKENEPDMQYPIDWAGGDRTPMELIKGMRQGQVLINDDGTVENFFESEDCKWASNIARDFFEAGLIRKDVMTATDFEQRLKDGKTFAYIERLKPGKAQETAINFSFPLDQAPITDVYMDTNAGTGAMMALSNKSKNPARVMRFLELFNTDKYLNNLIIYGIQDKHYKKLDGEYVEVIPNSGYTLSGSQWMMGNVFLNYLTKGEDADKFAKLAEFNDAAKKRFNYGFVFDPEPVMQEVTNLSAVDEQYGKQISLGAMDPTKVLPEFNQKLKAAGLDKYMAEVKKQLDAYKAQEKK